MTREQKIKSLMLELGLKAKDIARLTKIAPSKVSKLINGSQGFNDDEIFKFANILRVEPSYLIDEAKELSDTVRFVYVQNREDFVSDNQIELSSTEKQAIPSELFSKSVYAFKLDCDVMKPTIRKGDIVVCDKKYINNNDLVHFHIKDSGTTGVKRYEEINDRIILRSDNNQYESIIIDDKNNLELNKVIACIAPIKKL